MTTPKPILYLSFDIESDGPTPLLNNMISIGFYGITDDLENPFQFDANIMELEGHVQEKQCMENFWNKPENQQAWNYLQKNKRSHIDVCLELSEHFKRLGQTYKLVFISHPSCFDWSFFKNYYELVRSINNNRDVMYDIGYSCQCSSTLWNLYKQKHKLSSNEADKLYKEISEFDETKEHFALDDARCQGIAYVKMKQMLLN